MTAGGEKDVWKAYQKQDNMIANPTPQYSPQHERFVSVKSSNDVSSFYPVAGGIAGAAMASSHAANAGAAMGTWAGSSDMASFVADAYSLPFVGGVAGGLVKSFTWATGATSSILTAGLAPLVLGVGMSFLTFSIAKIRKHFKKERLTPQAYHFMFMLSMLKHSMNMIPSHRFTKMLGHLEHVLGPDVTGEVNLLNVRSSQFYVWDTINEHWVPQKDRLERLDWLITRAKKHKDVRAEHLYRFMRKTTLHCRKIVFDPVANHWIELRPPPREVGDPFKFLEGPRDPEKYNHDIAGYRYKPLGNDVGHLFEPLRNKSDLSAQDFFPLVPAEGTYIPLSYEIESTDEDKDKRATIFKINHKLEEDDYGGGVCQFLASRTALMWDKNRGPIRLRMQYRYTVETSSETSTTFFVTPYSLDKPGGHDGASKPLRIIHRNSFRPNVIQVIPNQSRNNENYLFCENLLRAFQKMLTSTGLTFCKVSNRPVFMVQHTLLSLIHI